MSSNHSLLRTDDRQKIDDHKPIKDDGSWLIINPIGSGDNSSPLQKSRDANSAPKLSFIGIIHFGSEILTPKRSIRVLYSVATSLEKIIISSPNTK